MIMKEHATQQGMRDTCASLVDTAVSNWKSPRKDCSWMFTSEKNLSLSTEDEAAKNALKIVLVVVDFSPLENEICITTRCNNILDMSATECYEHMKLPK